MDIQALINTVVGMFLVMATGYGAKKLRMFGEDFTKQLSTLILHIAQPCMIIDAMLKLTYSPENGKAVLTVLGIGVFMHIFAAAFAFLTMKVVRHAERRKISEYCLIFTNAMFFGQPIIRSLFGDRGDLWLPFYVVTFNIFIWTYGLVLLGRGRDDVKLKPLNIVLNYGTVTVLIGAILFFTGLGSYIPAGVLKGFSFLGGLCTPISLFIMGALIAAVPLKKLFSDLNVYLVCAVKLLIFPVMIYPLMRYVFGLDADFSLFAAVISGLPTAANAPMFAELYGIEPDFAAHTVGMMTALSTFTIPLVVYVLGFF